MVFKIDFDFTVQGKLNDLVDVLGFEHIDPSRVVAMRSKGSKANAYARIWSLERAWQIALNVNSHYIIEVLTETYDKLSDDEKEKTLIHELLHISQNFNGNLVHHKCFGKKMMSEKKIKDLHIAYKGKKGIKGAEQLKLGIDY